MSFLRTTLCVMVALCGLPAVGHGMSPSQAIGVLADRLVSEQVKIGAAKGMWPNASEFTGSIVTGMVCAYELTCEPAYKAAAEQGATYSLAVSGGNYYGDAAYAFYRLSEASADPLSNTWRSALEVFYAEVKIRSKRTEGYVAQFGAIDPADATFYLANHVVAAYYVDAADKLVWRNALIDALARVSDASTSFPVTGLALATWGLASTGPLDATRIDRSGNAAAYWKGRTLAELPGLLLSHQVPSGQAYAGSFYARFDHKSGIPGAPNAGYTEDLIFAVLGLTASGQVGSDGNVEPAVAAARAVLLARLGEDAEVWQHLWLQGDAHYVYPAEALQAFAATAVPGDFDLDDDVDVNDFTHFAARWRVPTLAEACDCRCRRADLVKDGVVDGQDLAVLADRWLVGTEP